MTIMLRPAVVLALAALALSGCSAVEAATPSARLATPSLPCTLPYGTHVRLLAPDALTPSGSVLLVASRELPATISLVATDRRGHTLPAVGLERLPQLRRAVAKPAFPNAVYYRAGNVALRGRRHYTLALEDLAQNGCSPYAALEGDAHLST